MENCLPKNQAEMGNCPNKPSTADRLISLIRPQVSKMKILMLLVSVSLFGYTNLFATTHFISTKAQFEEIGNGGPMELHHNYILLNDIGSPSDPVTEMVPGTSKSKNKILALLN